jgi:hypothetical protein
MVNALSFRKLCLCGGISLPCILLHPHPTSDAHSYCANGVCSPRREDCATSTSSNSRDSRDGAERYEDRAQRAHHFGVLGDQHVQRLCGIQEPNGCLRHCCHACHVHNNQVEKSDEMRCVIHIPSVVAALWGTGGGGGGSGGSSLFDTSSLFDDTPPTDLDLVSKRRGEFFAATIHSAVLDDEGG